MFIVPPTPPAALALKRGVLDDAGLQNRVGGDAHFAYRLFSIAPEIVMSAWGVPSCTQTCNENYTTVKDSTRLETVENKFVDAVVGLCRGEVPQSEKIQRDFP